MLLKWILFLSLLGLSKSQDCDGPKDVVYVVDDSTSIGLPNYNKVKKAIINTVDTFDIGALPSQTHVGYVSFDTTATVRFNLGAYIDKTAVENAIDSVPYAGGSTNILSGMTAALDNVFGQSGDRSTVSDIMVIVTDGQDNTDVASAQAAATARGITVWAVGVGPEVNYTQLVEAAGSADRVKNVTNFDFLEDALKTIPCQKPCRECMDQYTECRFWANQGRCAPDSLNADTIERTKFMEERCPVSCKLCNETCKDLDCKQECDARKNAGECDSNPVYMMSRCKKTCGGCDRCVNKHRTCAALEASSLCLSTNVAVANLMTVLCPASCGYCQTVNDCSKKDPTGHCPRDWIYNPNTTQCYYLTPKRLANFNTTRNFCLAAGGDLASIHSQAENDFITSMLPYLPSLAAVSAVKDSPVIGIVKGAAGWVNGTTGPKWTDGTVLNYVNYDPYDSTNQNGENYRYIHLNGQPQVPSAGYITGQWADFYDAVNDGVCKRNSCDAPPTTTTTTTTVAP